MIHDGIVSLVAVGFGGQACSNCLVSMLAPLAAKSRTIPKLVAMNSGVDRALYETHEAIRLQK